jgi:hypothetical protein
MDDTMVVDARTDPAPSRPTTLMRWLEDGVPLTLLMDICWPPSYVIVDDTPES